jgi:hypothetical protein
MINYEFVTIGYKYVIICYGFVIVCYNCVIQKNSNRGLRRSDRGLPKGEGEIRKLGNPVGLTKLTKIQIDQIAKSQWPTAKSFP